MSAVTALPSWDVPAVPIHPAAPGAPRRAHLRAVPDLPATVGGSRTGGQITRRGRLVVTTTSLFLCLIGAGVAAHAAIGGSQTPAGDTVVVQSGQTLSQVAHQAYPQLPVGNAIQRVQAANLLNTLQVYAGEWLQLPR